MSEKKRGRPKNRPVTVAEWEKSDEMITQKELIALLRDVQTKRLRELQRLDMNHMMARKQIKEQFNLVRGLSSQTDALDTTVRNLQSAIERGDDRAVQRLAEIESGGTAYNKLIEKQAEARENIKNQFRAHRQKVLDVGDRLNTKIRSEYEAREALKRATHVYVESLEHRIYVLENALPDMRKIDLLIAKIEFSHSKVKEIEQEFFKLKRALVQKGILESER